MRRETEGAAERMLRWAYMAYARTRSARVERGGTLEQEKRDGAGGKDTFRKARGGEGRAQGGA